MTTILQAGNEWLVSVQASRKPKTHATYAQAFHGFMTVLRLHGIKPNKDNVGKLSEKCIGWYAAHLKPLSPASEILYLGAIKGFYHYTNAEEYTTHNMEKVRDMIARRARKAGSRLPEFPEKAIAALLDHVRKMKIQEKPPAKRLRDLRDRALLFTLATTGLRIHEACGLTVGMLHDKQAVIIGKGDKQAKVRFSRDSIRFISAYLRERRKLDGATGKPLGSLPVFARHDKPVSKRIEPITTKTGREIVNRRALQFVGDNSGITPHKFRHLFVTMILRKSGSLKLAQELARHSNIQVTQRYAHLTDRELEQGYEDVFEK